MGTVSPSEDLSAGRQRGEIAFLRPVRRKNAGDVLGDPASTGQVQPGAQGRAGEPDAGQSRVDRARRQEAFANTLRQHLAPPSVQLAPEGDSPAAVVGRARVMHPLLGKRQAEIIELLAEEHPKTTNTGKLSRAMDYDQPNVYLTLQGLIQANLVIKDATQRPHQYGLSQHLFDEEILDL